MDYVVSVPLAPKVLLLPHAFNVEPYIDEHTMRIQCVARFRGLGFIDYNGGGMHIHSSLVSVVLHD